ncbi:MAG: glycerophosphodiester phosphodiesterase family protein [Elusimicrobiales bacterium]
MEFIAHRGASAYAPENTLDAFSLAASMGMANFELDIQLSADGKLAVFHDMDLQRLHNRPDKVAEMPYNALKELGVPLLEDVLRLLGRRGFLNIEIKNDGGVYAGIEEKALDCLAAAGMGWARRAAISSFHHPSLVKVRELDSETRLGVLQGAASFEDALALAKRLKAESVNISRRRATPEMMRAAHKAGLKVFVYTVNERDQALELECMGADAVFTNNPDICQNGWDKIGGTD